MTSFRRESANAEFDSGLGFRAKPIPGLPGYRIPQGLTLPGLVVLDLMRLFCDSASPAFLPAYFEIEERLFRLVDIITEAGRPVLFTRHAHENDDSGGLIGRIYGRLQRAEDPFNELVAGAKRRIPPAFQIIKNRHSAFSNETTIQIFQACDSVLIAGVQTHACVLATALDCSRLGFVPLVIGDACASRSNRLHLETLDVLASGHAYILKADEAIAALFNMGKVE